LSDASALDAAEYRRCFFIEVAEAAVREQVTAARIERQLGVLATNVQSTTRRYPC